MGTYILTKKYKKGFSISGNTYYFEKNIGDVVTGVEINDPYQTIPTPIFLRVSFNPQGQQRYVDIPINMLRKKTDFKKNNEIKSSFADGIARYKVKENVQSAKGGKFFKGEVLEGTKDTKMDGYIMFIRKNDFDGKNLLSEKFEVEKVDDSTPLTNPADFKGAIEESNKSDKTLKIFSTIGALGGLYYAYSKQKGFWGYVGFMVLGGIAGSLVANVVTKMKKPKLADSTQKDNTTASTSSTAETPLPSGANVKKPISVTDTSKMTKAQKIDLIVSTLSDPEQKGMDAFNKKFISTLNDAELNTWIKLSKALKDKDLQNAQTSTNEQKAKEQLYKILSTKYKISQKEFDTSMKKFGEALMNDFEKGMKEGLTNATEQVFKQGMTEQNQSMFSNFESSLDLDI